MDIIIYVLFSIQTVILHIIYRHICNICIQEYDMFFSPNLPMHEAVDLTNPFCSTTVCGGIKADDRQAGSSACVCASQVGKMKMSPLFSIRISVLQTLGHTVDWAYHQIWLIGPWLSSFLALLWLPCFQCGWWHHADRCGTWRHRDVNCTIAGGELTVKRVDGNDKRQISPLVSFLEPLRFIGKDPVWKAWKIAYRCQMFFFSHVVCLETLIRMQRQ